MSACCRFYTSHDRVGVRLDFGGIAQGLAAADALATALCVLDMQACQRVATAHHACARLDRVAGEGGIQPLKGWSALTPVWSCPADEPSAPAVRHPLPIPAEQDLPCSEAHPAR